MLTYNGEIYNHAELRAELSASGRTFRGHSDTEVLVEACAAWGVEATVGKLVGMFAFAVWDRATRTLTLARDRIGLKPLFWGRFGELFLFASELKALRAHPGWTPELDRRSLGAYMRWGHVPAAHCIYRGLHKLSPGQFLVGAQAGEPRLYQLLGPRRDRRRRRRPIVCSSTKPRRSAQLDVLLRDAVGRRMIADVPLGASCPGGIDSSLIVALMQARCSRPVHTFAIGFDEKRYDETADARAVANHLGTAHSELVVHARRRPATGTGIPVWFDEPFAIRSQIPAMVVSRLARRK